MEQMVQATKTAEGPAALPAESASGGARLRLTVVTPANNEQFELSNLPADTTAGQIVEQLVAHGFLPMPPAGRAYVMSVRGGSDLDPVQSLRAAGVRTGATLQAFTDTPGAAVAVVHRERLKADYGEMTHLRCAKIDWTGGGGTPPGAYVVTYRLPSYVDASCARRDIHRVRFELASTYPLTQPDVRMVDQPAVYHPNIFPDGRICIGGWSPNEGLAFVVIRVAKMLLYYPYVTNPQHPANPAAARWYVANRQRFPLIKAVAFPDPLTGIHAETPQYTIVRVATPAVPR